MISDAPDWVRNLDEMTAPRWVRCALQVNPYGYTRRHGHDGGEKTEADYNTKLVQAMVGAGIELIAVTDHYRIAESVSLLEEARKSGIAALPAFEAATAEGLHFLVIFDEATEVGEIERTIGKCEIHDRNSDSPQGGITAVELIDLCARQKLACVAAHVTQSNGILEHLSGQTRLRIWTAENLYGVTIPGVVRDLPAKYQPYLRNTQSAYKRPRPVAVLNAGDVSSPGDVAKLGRSCRLRMSSASQGALRHALLDPGSRVRLDRDDPPPDRSHLVAVHWDGGFLDGQTIPLAQELNVLVGAPGSGKSTVIESLRCALDLSPSSERSVEDHNGIRTDVLGNGTTVSLVLDHPTPTQKRYVIECTLPNPPIVRDADTWELSGQPISDLAPLPEIYGQHEIADLAADPQQRTQLLERFVNGEHQDELHEVMNELAESRNDVAARQEKVEELKGDLSLLPGARERLELFEKAKVVERLQEQTFFGP